MTDDRLQILTNRADAAALMLAAADDPDAIPAVIGTMTYEDAARMLVAALMVGGTMVRLADNAGGTRNDVRTVLGSCISVCASERERLAGDDEQP